MSYDRSAGQGVSPNVGYSQPRQGGQPGGAPVEQMPPTYRAWIVACYLLGMPLNILLACPTGLVANHYAKQVQSSWDIGDSDAAMTASKRARTWAIVSTVFNVLGLIFLINVI